ncbi:MAG: ABC transporter permease [Clostridia bacterium]|nr:ABC transporter permease [Clostridia bacterium]
MKLKDIALNNLRRRKIKMFFLVFGMVFGVATIVTLSAITATMQKEMQGNILEVGTRLIITPKTEERNYSYNGIAIPGSDVNFDVTEFNDGVVAKIQDSDGINVVAPKVLGAAKVQSSKRSRDVAVIVGVDFEKELQIKNYWRLVGDKPATEDQVLIGSNIGMEFKVEPGKKLTINGRDFVISGVIESTASDEDGLVFMNLATAQELLKKPDALSFLEVAAFKNLRATDEQVKAVVQQVSVKVPEARVTSVKDKVEARKELVDRFANFSLVVSVIVLIIGSLIVMTTMMSSVNERTREIGIFRAIGFRKKHIIKIILMEAGVVSVISGIVGFIVGMGVATLTAPMVVGNLKGSVAWNPLLAVGVLVLSTLVGLLASWYPAVKASRLDPAEALRFI